jgi:predicted O-linked N-acetylglucosamine transferase (SPINDLY family)
MANSAYDYIIADKIVIPEIQKDNFTEKVIYLPNCYQANDSKKIISSIEITKEEHGLPLDSFVFCSFNNTYKISPEIFLIWLNILKNQPKSVLWLINDNPLAVKNLQKFTEDQGVDPKRLIFAPRTNLSDHLARHKFADLFLDTFPYNAHTTASDALWAGLPVLTLKGESFASRVSASLLTSSGLTLFISDSLVEYENKAIYFSNNPDLIKNAKHHLLINNINNPLFNSSLFTKNLENAYKIIYKNYLTKLSPNHIYV